MPQQQMTEIKPGLYFAPGFYMAYWHECILKRFPIKTIERHNAFTKYRELFVGSILAAANTLGSGGTEYYVGLPATEPPDVELMYYEPTTVKGKAGNIRKHIEVEITRCNLNVGETIVGQIINKNVAAYKDMILAVFMEGEVRHIDYKAIQAALGKEEVIYPSSIVLVTSANMAGTILLLPGSFGLSQLYPKPGSSLINLNDANAFHRKTDVVGNAIPFRGVSTDWQDLGPFTLAPPKL
jgi:hypothetical protein